MRYRAHFWRELQQYDSLLLHLAHLAPLRLTMRYRKTKHSSRPIVGVRPPLTVGFVDARFGYIDETIGFSGGVLMLMFGWYSSTAAI